MVNNNGNITIREIKENIFYVYEYQSKLMDSDSGEKQGRKVRVGIFDNKIEKYFYRRLLACIIILKHSKEFQKYHSNIFENIITQVRNESYFPESLSNLQNIDSYMRFTRNNIDDIEISSKPVVYLLFILISFYNLNNLLNDFYLIFNRTFTYEKQQLEIQDWDSLIKDDFLLNMLIFGLDELELSENSEKYFESLQDKYIEKQKFYHQVIKSKELNVSSKLYRSIDVEKFLIEEKDKMILENNKLFDYLNEMTDEEREDTEKLILSLFLLLVASSYAVPSFVNSKRAEERGYKVMQDVEGTVSIQKVDNESATTISYWYGVKNPDVAELNKVLKEDATRDLQSKGSLKMGKAYVEKYTDGQNFMYTLVFKNAKPEDVLTSVAYYIKKEIPKSELNKYVDKLLAESEKYIK